MSVWAKLRDPVVYYKADCAIIYSPPQVRNGSQLARIAPELLSLTGLTELTIGGLRGDREKLITSYPDLSMLRGLKVWFKEIYVGAIPPFCTWRSFCVCCCVRGQIEGFFARWF